MVCLLGRRNVLYKHEGALTQVKRLEIGSLSTFENTHDEKFVPPPPPNALPHSNLRTKLLVHPHHYIIEFPFSLPSSYEGSRFILFSLSLKLFLLSISRSHTHRREKPPIPDNFLWATSIRAPHRIAASSCARNELNPLKRH